MGITLENRHSCSTGDVKRRTEDLALCTNRHGLVIPVLCTDYGKLSHLP